ncbi:Cytochrome aa3 oxidase assembly protein [Fictibacillus macauensis ZFHKF-1]|uniref:Cytochrome aa3 oxidase assembly protein n=1 Tax=Fictibacillus macauensis ZFHKF-1 TaxID=1196324 RepID=I8AEB9_9BACL|nr:heme A synthase [Fictibacillus macauensis]EIT83942.1 Cytochrome aa3 oxidase assembly protein [Fictibacillus macauensis ZFHKF-1]
MGKAFKWMAIITSVVMFILMIAGSLVTKTGSGMGCGSDWPLCNGQFIPEYTVATMIEYTHRVITGFAGILVFVFSIWAMIRYKGSREVRGLAILGITFIIVESIIGAAAVLWPQSAEVLAMHFGFSLLAFTGVALLSMYVLQKDRYHKIVKQGVSRRFKILAWVTVVYAYLDIYSGAYLRHKKASLACWEFPGCTPEQFFPGLGGLQGIHFLHRMAGVVLFVLIAALMIYAIRHYRGVRPDLYYGSIVAFILVLAQIMSGIAIIWTSASIFTTLAHSGFITLLFALLFYIGIQSTKKPTR